MRITPPEMPPLRDNESAYEAATSHSPKQSFCQYSTKSIYSPSHSHTLVPIHAHTHTDTTKIMYFSTTFVAAISTGLGVDATSIASPRDNVQIDSSESVNVSPSSGK
ncbi:hypothetical protein LMH87_004571 [Akanthomyces muscarius]|uniref:Uncharacterized protein n=1 Tax=Akanthomyces muscarius TaxID=2231603 RepID=A0A9W8Q5M1_AKAMU|nr:hypothetical protein LMH87_004571 [Akanthomyces muscarius]KAJ4145734.1 hypothetical protein LMH87_004571 [Akanthomyces muscarius]